MISFRQARSIFNRNRSRDWNENLALLLAGAVMGKELSKHQMQERGDSDATDLVDLRDIIRVFMLMVYDHEWRRMLKSRSMGQTGMKEALVAFIREHGTDEHKQRLASILYQSIVEEDEEDAIRFITAIENIARDFDPVPEVVIYYHWPEGEKYPRLHKMGTVQNLIDHAVSRCPGHNNFRAFKKALANGIGRSVPGRDGESHPVELMADQTWHRAHNTRSA